MTKLPFALGLVLLHATIFATAHTARAQDRGRTDDRPAAQRAAEAAPLAGPGVADPERDSLVVYEYGGQLQELGLPPAEAALELLDLDEATAARVAGVIAARALLAENLVTENFELFIQAETVEASGSDLDKGLFFLNVVRVLHPLIQRGRLEEEIRPLLPEETAREFDRLLDGYWRALGQARADEARAKGERVRLRKAVRQARQEQWGKEVELAAQRALESEKFAVEYLTKGLDLSEAQQDRIQKAIFDHMGRAMAESGGQASEDDVGRLFVEVLAFLNEEQRAELLERINALR